MRLNVTRFEIESGRSIQGGIKNRIKELTVLAARRDLVSISPQRMRDGKMIGAIKLIDDAVDGLDRGTSAEIKFRPIWCKLFTVCSMTKDTLTAMICEFEFGKYWVDKQGVREAHLTTSGPGCDQEVLERSELALSDILANEESGEIIDGVLNLVRRSF